MLGWLLKLQSKLLGSLLQRKITLGPETPLRWWEEKKDPSTFFLIMSKVCIQMALEMQLQVQVHSSELSRSNKADRNILTIFNERLWHQGYNTSPFSFVALNIQKPCDCSFISSLEADLERLSTSLFILSHILNFSLHFAHDRFVFRTPHMLFTCCEQLLWPPYPKLCDCDTDKQCPLDQNNHLN